MLTPSGQVRTFIVPSWIYKAILRNKLNIADIQDYGKMRHILSQDDLISWAYLNDIYTLRKRRLTLNSLVELFSGQVNPEYYLTVQPSSTLQENAFAVMERLKDTYSMTSKVNSTYEFITVNDMMLVILHEGFEQSVQDLEGLLSFLRDYMKALYKTATIPDASYSPLYSLYLELI